MYFKRILSDILIQASGAFPVVVVTGARQVGKTTLLRHIFPTYRFVSLDLPSLADMAENSPELFLQKYPPPVLIDEVQYAPKLFRYLKTVVDKDRHNMGQFIMTGSQKFTLMQGVSESLAGRAAILHLENLSVMEIPDKEVKSWSDIIARGLYPELWRNPELDAKTFYSSYVSTYLERDVRQILNVHSLRDFERLLRACAARSGNLLNVSELARDVGIKSQTARDWLSVLEASNQIFLLEPYFENVGKRIVKSPKLYLCDPGLMMYLLGMDESSLVANPIVGAIWETFVFAELRKHPRRSRNGQLWFYRDAQAREIDFVHTGPKGFELFEVKWTEQAEPRWIENLQEIAVILNRSKIRKVHSLNFICRTSNPHKVGPVAVDNPRSMQLTSD